MEKKDWKKKLRELSFMKGYYFKLENNGLVEKKDDQLVFNREELERFVQQELDKAREEGKREAFTKDEWFMLKLAMNDIFNSGNSAYEGISEKIKGYLMGGKTRRRYASSL
jgi:hypothetical protein